MLKIYMAVIVFIIGGQRICLHQYFQAGNTFDKLNAGTAKLLVCTACNRLYTLLLYAWSGYYRVFHATS